ncbi:MAG: phenylacetate-CoA oxygenase/reductase subunit PaaK [Saprospiraceae bacterium]|nr:phenylacetate-CoA oxygenase/reductase subunit PaaK [Saprospiraceae bacterium]
MTPKFHTLRVSDIRRETSDCVSIALEVPETLKNDYAYIPGQYLTLKTFLQGEEVRRSYSICASPMDGELRVAVKLVPEGLFSTFANKTLKVGDVLDVMTPMGNFHSNINPAQAKYYVAFAAGSGITPIMSIMKTVLCQEPRSHFTLFYGNRATDSIIFREAIEALKNIYLGRLSVHHVLSQEFNTSDLFTGRISKEKCQTFFEKIIDVAEVDEFFICGPQEMNEDIRDLLLERGMERKKIHVELFTTGIAKKQAQKAIVTDKSGFEAQVQITLDGNTFEFPLRSTGDSILDAALKAGADLPFACKGGVCCTCRAKLTEGKVEMDVNYALEPEELEAGYILTCQSHPTTARVVVDFDS